MYSRLDCPPLEREKVAQIGQETEKLNRKYFNRKLTVRFKTHKANSNNNFEF